MEFVKMIDYGNSADVFVDGVGYIQPCNSIVRIGYFATSPSSDGGIEHRHVLTVRWPRDVWLMTPCFRELKGQMRMGDVTRTAVTDMNGFPRH